MSEVIQPNHDQRAFEALKEAEQALEDLSPEEARLRGAVAYMNTSLNILADFVYNSYGGMLTVEDVDHQIQVAALRYGVDPDELRKARRQS